MDISTGTDLLLSILVTIVVAVWGYLKIKWTNNNELLLNIATALEIGARQTYETYVRECKFAAEDGKLTAEERTIARDKAIIIAKQYLLEQGVVLGKQIGEQLLTVILERVITHIKNRNSIIVDNTINGSIENPTIAVPN